MFLKIYSLLPNKLQNVWNNVEGSNIGSRIAKGAFWSLLGSAISQGLMLLATFFIARFLGKIAFGELGMLRSTLNLFTVFASFGMGLTATKYVSELFQKDKLKTGRIIGLSILFSGMTGAIISIIVFFLAPLIANESIAAPHLVPEIQLISIVIFFSALNGAQIGILAGLEAFKSMAKVNFFSSICTFPILLGFTYYLGLYGAILGLAFNFILLFVLNSLAVYIETKKVGIKIIYSGFKDEFSILHKFSLPSFLSGIIVTPTLWICYTMLVNEPKGYEEMALFNAAFQWQNAILFFPAMITQISLPLLSSSINSRSKFTKILKVSMLINFSSALFIVIFISIFSEFIMEAYGKDFSTGQPTLIILAFTAILISVNGVIGQALAGKGKMWIGFYLNLVWAIVLLIFANILLNLGKGAIGLAYAMFISYFMHTIFQSIIVFKYIIKE